MLIKISFQGEKPYICEVCDKAFARRDKLGKLMETEIKINLSVLYEFVLTFIFISILVIHMNKVCDYV